jgi:transcriptional regulator with XRE-family HTH domain
LTLNTADDRINGMSKPDLSELIREAIRQSGVSLYELGNHATVDPSILSRFMRGERSPTLETAERVLAALGCGVAITGDPSHESLQLVKRKRRRRRKDD